MTNRTIILYRLVESRGKEKKKKWLKRSRFFFFFSYFQSFVFLSYAYFQLLSVLLGLAILSLTVKQLSKVKVTKMHRDQIWVWNKKEEGQSEIEAILGRMAATV